MAGAAPKGRKNSGYSLVLVGVGGQGILLAGRVFCEAAMQQGHQVNAFESHGMAQRGGAVINHIRWGEAVRSSLIMEGSGHMLVALEPVEALRRLPLLGPQTTAIINTKTIPPITLSSVPGAKYPTVKQVIKTLSTQVGAVVALDGTDLAEELGNPAVLSAVMIGAAWATGELPLRKKHLMGALEQVVPKRFLDLNRRAFDAGVKAVRDR